MHGKDESRSDRVHLAGEECYKQVSSRSMKGCAFAYMAQ